jgi:beta-lactamase class A
MKTSSRIFGSIITAGALWLPSGHISAQVDPFTKDGKPLTESAELQPVTGKSFQEIADQAKPGILGVATCDLQTGSVQGINVYRSFSLQSVFKAFLAAAVLSEIDAGQLSLDRVITLTPADLRGGEGSIDHSSGGSFSVRNLLEAALIESDNSAADGLLLLVGGPGKVTAWLRDKGIDGIRVDRDLRAMERDELGIPPNLFPNENASSVVSHISEAARKAAFDLALSDTRDTATPDGAIHFLVALKKGDLLSKASTDLLLGWLQEVKTGQDRLKAGFPSRTILAHKTGTSISFEGVAIATNDIGLATLPDGRTLAIAVFLENAPGSQESRNALIAACARVVAQSN